MAVISEQLQQLTLGDVVETGRKLGSGAYGEVVEVRLSGLKCAGKKLHPVFFEQSPPDGQRAILSRFVEECLSLSKLRHPNIVQLIGVHFIRGTRLPMLVMELLPESLCRCLERHRRIPAYMETSILYDVSLGLLYLHSQTPPLVHRDLTANNVLLTSNMTAKLADLGVARIVDLNPAQLTARMTQCPGTPAYMPPEALSDRPHYDEKLDVFSFGNLILHVCTHQWPLPAPLLACDPHNRDILRPLTEVQRRQGYFDHINEPNPLKALARRCLDNAPHLRPSTTSIASELEQICGTGSASAPGYLEMAVENLTVKEQNRQLSDEITQLRQQNAQLRQQMHEKDAIAEPRMEAKPLAPMQSVKRYSRPIHTIRCLGKPWRAAITKSGDIVVTEHVGCRVTLYDREGREIASFGSKGNNLGQFDWPVGVAVTADSHILVANSNNSHIQKLKITGNPITLVGSCDSVLPQFTHTHGIAVHPSGKIFITEPGHSRVRVLNSNLSFSFMFGEHGSSPGQLSFPYDVACDSRGMVYVADTGNSRIQKFTAEGKFVTTFGSKGSEGELDYPTSLAVDQKDNVYVGEGGNKRVSVFSSSGDFLYCFGVGETIPSGLAIDEAGFLYVCDPDNKSIVVYS